MLWHLSCTIIYLFVCLFFCFLLLYIHLRPYFVFWSYFVFYLFVFCKQITYVCNCLMFAGCWRCHFLVLGSLLPLWIYVFVLDALLDLYLSRFNLIYLTVEILLLVFDSFHVCFFLPCKSACYINLHLLVFIFVGVVI